MRSHTYDFKWQDLARAVGAPLAPVLVFAVLFQGATALRLLPAPRPTRDTDKIILIHQLEASRRPQPAQIVLIGDSSCLMDVSARQLGQTLGCPVLNLAIFSYLDLAAYAALVREYAQANPGQLRTLVLLMHPEALRRAAPEADYVQLFQALLDRKPSPVSGIQEQMLTVLGLAQFRDRCLARLLPSPLGGAFGRTYGFSSDLDQFLTRSCGSLVELDSKPFTGDADYRLGVSLQNASRAFRAAVPPGCQLVVGITPSPEGFVRARYRQNYRAMLDQWSRW